MNRYKKTVQNMRSKHNRIVAFSEEIQEAMGLTDGDVKIVFRNNMSWDLPDFYKIKCSTSQGYNVLVVEMSSQSRWAVKNPPSKTEQKKFIKLIKENK